MNSNFYPKGHHVLNRTEWWGKEPRSCAGTGLRSRLDLDNERKAAFGVEVSYRLKGYIGFPGNTKYDGWTAMMLNKAKDGTVLNVEGKPLPPGQPPVYLSFEVYEDAASTRPAPVDEDRPHPLGLTGGLQRQLADDDPRVRPLTPRRDETPAASKR